MQAQIWLQILSYVYPLFWLNYLKWRKIKKKITLFKKVRIKPDLLWEKESFRAWEGGQRGEGVKQRRWELLMGQWAYGWGNGWEKRTASLSSQVPKSSWSWSQDNTDSRALVGVKVGEGCHSLKLDAVSTDETEVCLHTAAPVASIQAWDMLNLILLAIVNSQNIDHLFPGFLTALLPGLSAQRGWQSPEQVFPLLTSSKTPKAAHQTCTVSKIIKSMDSNLQQHESN